MRLEIYTHAELLNHTPQELSALYRITKACYQKPAGFGVKEYKKRTRKNIILLSMDADELAISATSARTGIPVEELNTGVRLHMLHDYHTPEQFHTVPALFRMWPQMTHATFKRGGYVMELEPKLWFADLIVGAAQSCVLVYNVARHIRHHIRPARWAAVPESLTLPGLDRTDYGTVIRSSMLVRLLSFYSLKVHYNLSESGGMIMRKLEFVYKLGSNDETTGRIPTHARR